MRIAQKMKKIFKPGRQTESSLSKSKSSKLVSEEPPVLPSTQNLFPILNK